MEQIHIYLETFASKDSNFSKNKFVLLGDLNFSPNKKGKEFIPLFQAIHNEKPTAIFLTGNMITDPIHIIKSENFQKRTEDIGHFLAKIAPTFYSIGGDDIAISQKLQNGQQERKACTSKILKDTLGSIEQFHILENETIEMEDYFVTGFTPSYDYYYKDSKQLPGIAGFDLMKLQEKFLNFERKKGIFLTDTTTLFQSDFNCQLVKDYSFIFCGTRNQEEEKYFKNPHVSKSYFFPTGPTFQKTLVKKVPRITSIQMIPAISKD